MLHCALYSLHRGYLALLILCMSVIHSALCNFARLSFRFRCEQLARLVQIQFC